MRDNVLVKAIYILYIYYAPGCIQCTECTQANRRAGGCPDGSVQLTTPPHSRLHTLIHPTRTHPTILLLPYPFSFFSSSSRSRSPWRHATTSGCGEQWHQASELGPLGVARRDTRSSFSQGAAVAPFNLPGYVPSHAARGPRRGGRRARRSHRGAARRGVRILQVRDRPRP
jgi:hypothetical protein